MFDNNADDSRWKRLGLKPGEYFIFTREMNTLHFQKPDPAPKAPVHEVPPPPEKALATGTRNVRTNKNWKEEEISRLWSGTVPRVAALLHRTPAAIHSKRHEITKLNPTFTPPSAGPIPIEEVRRLITTANKKVEPAEQKTEPVVDTEQPTLYKMKIAGKEIELFEKPKRVKYNEDGSLELEF